ncbi:COG4648 family protein [Bombella intestini]|uniref:hypothetical protein n=1 Tax=Bombella intestini TaxID=1539051 RepID=UPI0011776C44|nr:hypothetical protein [Bombella intestini]
MMIGKVYHNLAAGLLSSKGQVGRLWRFALLFGGIGLVGLVPSSWGVFAGCISLGVMMQLVGLLSGRSLAGLLLVPVMGVLGWYFPACFRLYDQIAIYELMLLGMLRVFARSLRQGRVPLVTCLAEAVHGSPLRPDVQRYTVRLTWAWCLFFILALLAPLILWLCAMRGNLWRLPLEGGTVLATFVCFAVEMVVRRLVIRNYDHSTLKQNFMAGRAVFMRKDLK